MSTKRGVAPKRVADARRPGRPRRPPKPHAKTGHTVAPETPVLKPTPQTLLALRKRIAERRPRFQRQEWWRYRRIHRGWRRPKGIDSKMRLQVKGWPPLVKIGFRGTRAGRGLHPSGLRERLVRNLEELEAVEPTREAARFAQALGRRARAALLARARLRGVHVLNPGRAPPPREEEAA